MKAKCSICILLNEEMIVFIFLVYRDPTEGLTATREDGFSTKSKTITAPLHRISKELIIYGLPLNQAISSQERFL